MAGVGAQRATGPTPLFGRHQVVEELLAQLQRSRSGAGRLVLLVGNGGVGKSTILLTSSEIAKDLEFRVLVGRALPAEPPEPFALVRSLLQAAQEQSVEIAATEPPSSPTLPMFLAPFETDETGAAARATGLADERPEAREADRLLQHLAHPVERVDADRSALFTRLGEFFLRLSDDRPLLLALDDLHFADDSTLEFLIELLPTMAGHRILILAGIVPGPEAPPRVREALDRLAATPSTASVRIPAMTETELAEFVRWLLRGRDPGHDAIMRWFTQTEGNPLFAEYLVRAATGLGRDAKGVTLGARDLGELLKSTIESLPDAERRLLVYGSVIGKEFDFPTVAAAAGQEEERLSEALDHLVQQGLLREKGGEVYEFVSERARADVYAQLTETRRRLLHRNVATALAARSPERTSDVFELARQYYLAREDTKAVEYNRRASELAAHSFAFESATVHLERALESVRRLTPRDLGREIRLLVELGRYLDELGDLPRSEEVLTDAVGRARIDATLESELALALLELAHTRSDLAKYAEARDLVLEAFPTLEKQGNRRGLLAAHRVLGIVSWRMGDLASAEKHQREELAIAEAEGTPIEVGHALIDLANTFTLQSPTRTMEAMALYERSAKLLAGTGDDAARARVLMNLALLLHYARRPEESLARMQEAAEAADRSRARIWIGYCQLNLAQFYAERHDVDRATSSSDRAWSLLEPLGDQLARQQLTMIRGLIAEEDHRYDDAETFFHEAQTLAQKLDLSAEQAEMEYRFADLEERRGRLDSAREHVDAARAAGIERLRADLLPRLTELADRLGRESSPTTP